jgi:GNAT superfamily N-acetyltransferase
LPSTSGTLVDVCSGDKTLGIREARVEDVPAIVALYAEDELGRTREHPAQPLPTAYWEAFTQIAADPRHRLVVMERAGEVVGTVQLSFIPHLVRLGTERAQIEAVRVAASSRGVGLGRALLEWAIAQARDRGCGIVQLTTDASRPDAHRLYGALGFEPTHVGMKLVLDTRG